MRQTVNKSDEINTGLMDNYKRFQYFFLANDTNKVLKFLACLHRSG